MMRYGEYELDWQFHNSGGLVKTPETAERMARTASAAVLAGSMVLDRRVGNSPDGEVVDFCDEETQTTYNALGMPMPPDHNNPGDDPGRVQPKDFDTFAKEDLQQMVDVTHEHDKPFVLNFAVVSDNPAAELKKMGNILKEHKITGIDALELNISCPNIVLPDGTRHQTSTEPGILVPVFVIARTIREAGLVADYGVRLAPPTDRSTIRPIIETLHETNADFVSIFNTFPGGMPRNKQGEYALQVKGNVGGMSGKGMAPKAEELTKEFMEEKEMVGATFYTVGSNGVVDAETMCRRLALNVDATSGTTLFWQAENGWGDGVGRLAAEMAK